MKTGLFLPTTDSAWTPTRTLARDFESTRAAIRFVVTEQLPGLEVVLSFGDPLYDLSFPALLAPPGFRETGVQPPASSP